MWTSDLLFTSGVAAAVPVLEVAAWHLRGTREEAPSSRGSFVNSGNRIRFKTRSKNMIAATCNL